jgi:hypothetical protein
LAEATDAGELPLALVATTLTVKDLPAVSPVMVHEVAPVVEQS